MIQLAERFQFSYWIDRRVDVDRPITLTIADGTLRVPHQTCERL